MARILVTFDDKTIQRAVSAGTTGDYAARTSYTNSGWSRRIANTIARRHALRILAQWPMTALGVSCVVYQVDGVQDVEQLLDALAADEHVGSAQRMGEFRTLQTETNAAARRLPEGLESMQYSDPYLPLQTAFRTLHIDQWHTRASGRGIRIALIDSGVDTHHPDLEGQVKRSENLAPSEPGNALNDVHGTAVAGVLSAVAGNGIGIAGIAPDAEIFAFRACWPDGATAASARCNTFTLAMALNEAIRLRSHIINLSLSGPDDTILRLLIERALQQGIVVVAAVPERKEDGGFPANLPGVLAVTGNAGGDSEQIVAPGSDILTTVPRSGYEFMSGSSFATAHVAGLAALMLELHPRWSAADIRDAMLDPAGPMHGHPDDITAIQ
ncbi:MAG: S8 family serine peptidase [Pseudomonadales bacterium]|nr:S8 family serine peptidase [Pseudomonadales bacterium]